jgi:anti-anti-sigma factor
VSIRDQVQVANPGFECSVVCDGEAHVIVQLRGEVDSDRVDSVNETFRGALSLTNGDLTVDVSELSFMAACGLGVLAWVADDLAQRSRRLRVVGASPLLVRMLEVTDLDRCLEVHDGHRPQSRGGGAPTWLT